MFSSLFRADGGDDRSVFGDFWFEPVSVRSAAGMRVSGDAALRLTAVYACVRILAETMGCLPLCLYKPREDGGRDAQVGHWLSRLMKKPNRWQDGFQWREMMQGHASLRGAGYNRIIPNSRGEIVELQPLHPDRMSVELLDSGNFRYRYKLASGDFELLPPGSVFRILGLSSNGLTALNPVELARESIGEGLAQQDYGSRFFANDARPMGGWIEYAGNFKDKDAKTGFRDSWQQAQAGANRGKTAVLENGMKYHELGLKNVDAQFIEGRKLKISDIARIFRVPPHMIADLERSTNNNIEWQSLEFVKFTMLPWAERWEAAIEDQLLGPDEGLEVEFDFWALERGDMKSRAEYYNLGITGGWLLRNEARTSEGRNPLPGLDKPLQPLNMKTPGEKVEPPSEGADDQARARSLELAIAGRVVRKETVAARKAYERFLGKPDAWRAWLAEFYREHAAYVAESLLCSRETATAWCDGQLKELLALTAGEMASPSTPQVLAALEAWESTAAAELAARVQTSALKP